MYHEDIETDQSGDDVVHSHCRKDVPDLRVGMGRRHIEVLADGPMPEEGILSHDTVWPTDIYNI